MPGIDVRTIVQRQRTTTMRSLQELTTLKRNAGDDVSWLLVVESMIFAAEAEIRWLDHCESMLVRRAGRSARGGRAGTSAPADRTDSDTAGAHR